MGRYIGEHRDDGFHLQELVEGLPAWFRRYGWTVAIAALGLFMLVWSCTAPAHAETTLQNLGNQPSTVSPTVTPRPTIAPITPGPTPVATPAPPATSDQIPVIPIDTSATTTAPTASAPAAQLPVPTPAPTTSGSPTPVPTTPAPTPTNTTANEQTIQAYTTGYSYFDNTPPGSADISNPVLHSKAGGTGTFDDPITVAVGHSIINGQDVLDWPAGTRFYIPNLHRYFIAEDTCGDGSTPQAGPCHTGYPSNASTWLDLWVGGAGGTAKKADSCMDAITGVHTVIVNPKATYPVTAGDVYSAAGCTPQYGEAIP